MKYISRITALLLALMMLTPTFASAITVGTATQSDLDALYEVAANQDGAHLEGLVGKELPMSVSEQNAHDFQWYQVITNADGSVTEVAIANATTADFVAVYQAETYAYFCQYLDERNEMQRTAYTILEPTRDLDYYVAELSWSDDFLSPETDVWNTEAMYQHLSTVWNVTLDGANLAESIVAYWWNNGEVYETEVGMLCSCVVSGKVQDSWCMLHPSSNLHADDCGWAKDAIMSSMDVSTPEKLLELDGQTIKLIAPVAGADDYNWQYYAYDEDRGVWAWNSIDASGDTLELLVTTSTIQTGYRLVTAYAYDDAYNFIDSKPFYLGGYDFYNWIQTTDGIQAWMADGSVTLADVVAKYNAVSDEEDRVNAEDYTYGEEGESVNLKVPQGTFAEDYVMEIEPVVAERVTELQKTVMALMDATGTHAAQMLMALDISFASLADRANKLQPDAPVALTFEVDTTGIDEALKYLYVFHIADNGTPEVVAGPIEAAFGVQTIEVKAEAFSEYLVMATSDECVYCQNHEYCFYDELLIYYKMPADQYSYLMELADDEFDGYLSDYVRHIEAGAPYILCTCVEDYEAITKDELKSPEDDHSESCPWADKTKYLIGLLGLEVDLAVDAEGTYKWSLESADGTVTELNNQSNTCKAEYEAEAKLYICEVTTTAGTTEYRYYVQADITNVYQYLAYLEGLWDGDNRDRSAIYEWMTTTWNVQLDETVGNTLAKAILVYWKHNYIDDYYYEDVLCSCCIGADNVVSDQIMLHPDALHNADCPWYKGSPVVELRAETDDEGRVVSYILFFMDENYEEQILATSTLMSKDDSPNEYHYFQDETTGWYVAYLHEEINEDGTVTQWIIPLPSEEDGETN